MNSFYRSKYLNLICILTFVRQIHNNLLHLWLKQQCNSSTIILSTLNPSLSINNVTVSHHYSTRRPLQVQASQSTQLISQQTTEHFTSFTCSFEADFFHSDFFTHHRRLQVNRLDIFLPFLRLCSVVNQRFQLVGNIFIHLNIYDDKLVRGNILCNEREKL